MGIEDDARRLRSGRVVASAGRGILGMRERVSALGGSSRHRPPPRAGCASTRASLSSPPCRSRRRRDGMTTILLVDDHPIVREGYRRLLGRQPGFHVRRRGGGRDGRYTAWRDAEPDVTIMDLSLRAPGAGGDPPHKAVGQARPHPGVHHALRLGFRAQGVRGRRRWLCDEEQRRRGAGFRP